MSDRPQSTRGAERFSNVFFSEREQEAFVRRILANVPPFPDYYRRMKRVNSEGPKLLGTALPGGEAIAAPVFRERMAREEAIIVDVRSAEAFGAGHIPGAINIGAGASFVTWAAWLLPPDRPIQLVGDSSDNLDPARRALVRVGLDNVRGSLQGGMSAWAEQGWEQERLEQVTAAELRERWRSGATIVDVRSDAEWAGGHIDGARHIMGGDLPKRVDELPRDRAIHLICATGYRSGIAASLLRRAGFRDVANVVDGMNAWRQLGLPVATGS